ncbi:MAG: PIN domain-containing protein [Rhodospirillaceae bacterium]|nr:PIN domain-containing protein [Rhodospirillaceae bacterium]
MRIVIDCNVLVSAARSGGICASVIFEAMRDCQPVLSRAIVEEYKAVAGRPKHARYRDGFLAVIAELERVAVFVEPANTVFGLSDPDDEIYLAAATTGGAALITGNSRDFTEPRYGSVEIFSPRSFIDRTD